MKNGMASRRRRAPGNGKTLPAVRPNAGIEATYRKKLDKLIADMQRSITYWVERTYRGNLPETVGMAQDMSAARTLTQRMRYLGRIWQRRFDRAATEMAREFATSSSTRADGAFRTILKKAGFTVKFTMTPAANDVVQATIGENVSLIKSIASEHLMEVEGLVMRSVQRGRDLGELSKQLQVRYGVTRNRAATIARDQNNKMTASINRVRQNELGITEAIWIHSTAGNHPRPSHVANSGKKYEIAKGAYIDGEWILPGEKINCRCLSRSIIPGLH